ncbi:hypothetical protein ACLOJK_000602 [Asimina triloba]
MASFLSSLFFCFVFYLSLANAACQADLHCPDERTPQALKSRHPRRLVRPPPPLHHAILCTYDSVISGFAAALDFSEAEALRHYDSFHRIHEDTLYHLHTTRTPNFLGLNSMPTTRATGNPLMSTQLPMTSSSAFSTPASGRRAPASTMRNAPCACPVALQLR